MSSGSDDLCPAIAPFLGYMGVMSAVVFASEFAGNHLSWSRFSLDGIKSGYGKLLENGKVQCHFDDYDDRISLQQCYHSMA